jgi:hypothetical protein
LILAEWAGTGGITEEVRLLCFAIVVYFYLAHVSINLSLHVAMESEAEERNDIPLQPAVVTTRENTKCKIILRSFRGWANGDYSKKDAWFRLHELSDNIAADRVEHLQGYLEEQLREKNEREVSRVERKRERGVSRVERARKRGRGR